MAINLTDLWDKNSGQNSEARCDLDDVLGKGTVLHSEMVRGRPLTLSVFAVSLSVR